MGKNRSRQIKKAAAKQRQSGREKGIPNLRYTDHGTVINKNKAELNVERVEYMKKLVKRADYKRKKMLKHEAGLAHFFGGEKISDNRKGLLSMGSESDFIIQEKTAGVHRFKSQLALDVYINQLENVLRKEYVDERVDLYKENLIKAMENTFGDAAPAITEKLRGMSRTEFLEFAEQDEALEFDYVYGPDKIEERIQKVRGALRLI